MQVNWNNSISNFDKAEAPPNNEVAEAKKTLPTQVFEELGFSHNWNNKLECEYFTTFRMHNPKKYQKGFKKTIYLSKKLYGKNVIIHDLTTITLDQMKPWMKILDTGLSPSEFDKLMKKMYSKHVTDWQTQKWDFMLLKTLKPQ